MPLFGRGGAEWSLKNRVHGTDSRNGLSVMLYGKPLLLVSVYWSAVLPERALCTPLPTPLSTYSLWALDF